MPELASRAHQSNIIPVIHLALEKAQISIDDVNAVAVTQGPGLMGSLLVGTNVAKGICIANNIPLIGVNHLEAHVAALFIDHQVKLPMLCLLVSGGHTQIILVNGIDDMKIAGTTQDAMILSRLLMHMIQTPRSIPTVEIPNIRKYKGTHEI